MVMESNKLVSIIIPTYNRAHLIGETLDSISSQTYKNWECIVVDDGSSDNTDKRVAAYILKDPRFKYYRRPEEHLPGGNGARNFGFKMSRGEYVQWFDSDDLMTENKIEEQLKDILSTNTHLQLCSGVKEKNGKRFSIKQELSEDLFRQFALNKTEILTPTALFDRVFFENHDIQFEEKLTRGQENYFFFQVLTAIDQEKVHQSTKELFIYKLHDSSISGADQNFSVSNAQSKFFIFREIFNYNKVTVKDIDIEAKMARKMIRICLSSMFYKDDNAEEYYKFLTKELNPSIYKLKIVYYFYKLTGIRSVKLRKTLNQYILKEFK